MTNKKRLTALVLVIVGLMAGSFLYSQGMTFTRILSTHRSSYDKVVVSGNYAYCLDEFLGFDILDISNPANPVQISNYPVLFKDGALAVEGENAFIIDGNRILHVIGISNPASPQPVTTYSLPESSKNLILVGNQKAYIPFSGNTVGIFDISNPAAPTLVSQFKANGSVQGLFATSNKLYVISYDNTNTGSMNNGQVIPGKGVLEILDVSDKRMPRKLGTWEIDKQLTGIWVTGNHAYVTLGMNELDTDGLWVIDVTNPCSPRTVTSFKTIGIPRNLSCSGGKAYFSIHYQLYCIDISTPQTPELSWKMSMPFSGCDITVFNNYAYTIGSYNGMQILDISGDGEPKILGTFSSESDTHVLSLAAQGDFLYTISYSSIRSEFSMDIYNLANDTPVPVSKYQLPQSAKRILVSGDYACIYIVEDKLIIIDISNPAAPVKVGEIGASYFIVNIFFDGKFIYLQLDSGSFYVYDISDPAAPVFRASIEYFWSHVFIKNNIAYLPKSFLYTYDLTDPANPVELGTTSILPDSRITVISGDYAILSHFKSFMIADISNPSAPAVVGQYDFSTVDYPSVSYINNITANGSDLFFSFQKSIFAFDISKPSKPKMIGAYNGLYAQELLAVNNKIVCKHTSGFDIFSYARTDTPASINVSTDKLYFSASASGTVSPGQSFLISNGGQGSLNWQLTVDSPWLSFTPSSGTTGARVYVAVNPLGLTPGRHFGTITITDPLADNSPRHVWVSLEVQIQGQSNPPFGIFEAPENGSTVAGSIAVSGWALDDIGVGDVKIYREDGTSLVYIGDAFFVEGARPDVEAAYPGYPNCNRAGWGYTLLTNYLPGGDGVFTLHAIATDQDGNETTLGTRTFTVDNANSVIPFGTIDTPEPGGTASGNAFVNFGWALTQRPNTIPLDGSTITVWVDGVPVGHPVYNQYRADIAGFLPGYNNSNGAGGYFYLDTTAFEDGMHTIQWTVTDDAGNRDGIGSRFFYISDSNLPGEWQDKWQDNRTVPGTAGRIPGNLPEMEKKLGVDPLKSSKRLPVIDQIDDFEIANEVRVIGVRQGYNLDESFTELDTDQPGIFSVQTRLGDRLEIQFPETRFETGFGGIGGGIGDRLEIREIPNESATGIEKQRTLKIEGFQTLGNKVYRLPIGSTLDPVNNRFIWQPGPGFAGEFRLVFIIQDHSGHKRRIHVNITIL